ncbi:MAG: methionyl-tRNA formyltransferase [Peptococcaceae bacterium]|jgi:methionyl-tRNA formyltransferase|nr:methionyl-tRNA formyltransferase [Peptococcaceae bacterium]
MRLVFMGTPEFAVASLQALVAAGHRVLGVFTQPDRQAGRGKQLQPSPVKIAALERGLPLYQPERVTQAESVDLLRELKPDGIIVVAYGQILSKEILELPPKGCVNVHASLLPAYRGAAPIHWAIIHGEAVTGVTTMLMDEGLDTGDVLLQRELRISPQVTMGEIHDALANMGAELLLQTLQDWEMGQVRPLPQKGVSCYAPRLQRQDEQLDWAKSALMIHNRIRGLNPWPGAYTRFRDETVKVWRSQLVSREEAAEHPEQMKPGEIIGFHETGVLVNTGNGSLCLLEVQPTGKRRMSARDFLLGRHGKPGEVFEGWKDHV